LSCAISLLAFSQNIAFIENKGQWPTPVRFSASTETGKVFFEDNRITHHFIDLSEIKKAHRGEAHEQVIRGHVVQQVFVGSQKAKIRIDQILKTKYNYFLGNDASHWASDCRSVKGFTYMQLYPGVDLHVHQNDYFMKYDWLVAAHANPNLIRWKYEGGDDVKIENGRLILQTALGEVVEQRPIAYLLIPQEGEAAGNNPPHKVPVACEFIQDERGIGFAVGKYDKRYTLIIDPELIFSSYSGSFDDNFGYTATYDSQGNLISGSSAFGQGYPTTLGAYQTTWGGGDGQGNLAGTDMALSKYDASGTFMQWSTFLGGINDDLPHSIICNSNDELYVLGTTSSTNFAVTANAFDNSFNGGTAFAPFGVGTYYVNGSDMVVSRLSVNGDQLLSSTYVGGSDNDGVNTAVGLKFNYADEFRGEIDLDDNGNVLIASSTFSVDFPTVNATQPSSNGLQEACVFKMPADLSGMLFSTYLGGTDDDSGFSLAFDSSHNIYVCGGTQSTTLSLVGTPYQNFNAGGSSDGWIMKLAANGSQILAGTFLGSSAYDQLYFIETDSDDNVFVYGQTRDAANSFIINAAFSQPNSGMLVTKFDPLLSSIVWSAIFGSGVGKPNLSPAAFLVDVCGKIYLSGWGGAVNQYSTNQADYTIGMTTTAGAFQTTTDGSDFYLLVLEADASAVTYSSFFGGNVSAEHVDGGTSRFDRKGIIYQSVCAGCGGNSDFPIFPANAVSAINNNSCNNGVFKYDFELPLTVADFYAPPVLCAQSGIQLTSTSTLATNVEWHFSDDNSVQTGNTVFHSFPVGGTFTVTLIASNPATCNAIDSITRTIQVITPMVEDLTDVNTCPGVPISIGQISSDPNATYSWTPNNGNLSDLTSPTPVFTGNATATFQLLIHHNVCTDTLTQTVNVPQLSLTVSNDTVLCTPDVVSLSAVVNPVGASLIWSDQSDFSTVLNSGATDYSIDVNVVGPQTYYAQLSLNGCTVEESVTVNLVEDQATIQGDFIACYGDTLFLNVLNPNPSFTYQWTSTAAILDGQGTSGVHVQALNTTLVSVSALTPFGCYAQDTVQISVSALNPLVVNATAYPGFIVTGGSSQLNVLPTGFSYTWNHPESLTNSQIQNPVATPVVDTWYTVQVSEGDCVVSDSVWVRVTDFICGMPSIFVPNAFTPNFDNKNEWLYVRGNNIVELDFYLYDRWGEKVFETHSLSDGWNGFYKGKKVDPAVFVYYIRAVCEGGDEFFDEGNITVLE